MKIALILCLFTFCLGSAYAADTIYKVIYSKGKVEFSRDKTVRPLLKGDLLVAGDAISTGGDGLVILGFDQDFSSRIKITKNSSFVIEGNKTVEEDGKKINRTSFILELGNSVINWVNKDKQKNRLQVKTKIAAMGVRGTTFFVHHGTNNQTVTAVQEGLVMARHLGGGVGIALSSKEGVVFTDSKSGQKSTKPSWYNQINWGLFPVQEDPNRLQHGARIDEEIRRALSKGKNNAQLFKKHSVKKVVLNEVEKALQKQCDGGDGGACADLGLSLMARDFGDHPKVRELFNKACEHKNERGCVWVGRLQYEFDNQKLGQKIIKERCYANSAYACYTLFELLKQSGDTQQQADSYFKKSLEMVHGLKNVDETIKRFKSSCNMDDAQACSNVAILMESLGKGKEASELYRKACDLGDGTGCSNLGYIHQQEGDLKSAQQLYQKACFGDVVEGCYNLAGIYSIKGKLELSIQYLKMALTGGFKDWKTIESDKDLANLRKSSEYQKLRKGK